MSAHFIVLFYAACGLAAAETPSSAAWHIKTSPHFEVRHESAWSPGAISLEAESIYASMRMNMAMFAPWMVKERTRIYIYSSQASYLNGEFAPPRWSKGLAYCAKKTIVVYDTGDSVKLKAVIAHELSHLYFESYFAEKLNYPPVWLDEGLAVYMEDLTLPEGGPWRLSLAYFQGERRVPFPDFFRLKAARLGSDARIGDWYLQSFGTVMYLYRAHTRLQFKSLCEELRGGAALDDALWKIYRLRDGADLTRKWSAWLDAYAKEDDYGTNAGPRSASFNFTPVRLSSFTFTDFGSKK